MGFLSALLAAVSQCPEQQHIPVNECMINPFRVIWPLHLQRHTEATGHRASMVTHQQTSCVGSSLPCSALDPTCHLSLQHHHRVSDSVPLERFDLFSLPGIREGHLLHSTEQEGQLMLSTLVPLMLTLPDMTMWELEAPIKATPCGRDKKT